MLKWLAHTIIYIHLNEHWWSLNMVMRRKKCDQLSLCCVEHDKKKSSQSRHGGTDANAFLIHCGWLERRLLECAQQKDKKSQMLSNPCGARPTWHTASSMLCVWIVNPLTNLMLSPINCLTVLLTAVKYWRWLNIFSKLDSIYQEHINLSCAS